MDNLAKKPKKGILKNSASIERQDSSSQLQRQNSHDKDIKWDEMNIMQTLHPADKDYGHMKIEEPKTPYSYYLEEDDGELHSDNESSARRPPAALDIDPDSLAQLIHNKQKSFELSENELAKLAEDPDWFSLSEEEKQKRRDFEIKRKKHYNEFQMVKMARQLLKEELGEGEEDESGGAAGGGGSENGDQAMDIGEPNPDGGASTSKG